MARSKAPRTVKALTRPIIQPMPLSRCLAMKNVKNPKAHSIDDLIESFVRFGFKAFPTIDEATMIMVAGHGRCEALERMRTGGASPPSGIAVRDGEWLVPIIRGLSFSNEHERDAYMIADNAQTIIGSWDFPLLADLLRELEPEPNGFDGLGFSDDGIDAILGESMEEDDDDDDGPGVIGGGKEVDVNGHTRVIGGHQVRPPVQMTNEDWTLHLGDCVEGMRQLDDNSVDAIVTDPPAGIGLMSKEWDSDKGGRDQWIAWLEGVMTEGIRVLKPGGYLLSWALPRTSHWTATGIENAGFDIRDIHHHIFLSGMPKSLDLAREIDMHLCELPGRHYDKNLPEDVERQDGDHLCPEHPRRVEATATRTGMKPAVEHYVLARKPLNGTYAENVLEFGTGGLNVDACRIGDEQRINQPAGNRPDDGGTYNMSTQGMPEDAESTCAIGRWPAHVTVSPGVEIDGIDEPARYFYCPKASRSETEAGLNDLPASTGGEATGRKDGSIGVSNPRAGTGRGGGRRNRHPSKKSIALMRWLVRLVTPPGGLVLDMFAGSGSTGLAALVEGCRFVGYEKELEYHTIATARLRSIIEDPRRADDDEADDSDDTPI